MLFTIVCKFVYVLEWNIKYEIYIWYVFKYTLCCCELVIISLQYKSCYVDTDRQTCRHSLFPRVGVFFHDRAIRSETKLLMTKWCLLSRPSKHVLCIRVDFLKTFLVGFKYKRIHTFCITCIWNLPFTQ